MNESDRKILLKMTELAEQIEKFTDGKSFEDFENDIELTYACAFALSQMSECAFGTLQANPSKKLSVEILTLIPETDREGLRKTRHILIHHYEDTNFRMLWDALTVNVPKLKQILVDILNNAETIKMNVETDNDDIVYL